MNGVARLAAIGSLRLRREGGLAAIPALQRERSIALDRLDGAQRQRLQALLDELAVHSQPRGRVGTGDRRYFTIAWDGAEQPLRIAEERASPALLRLWHDGAL